MEKQLERYEKALRSAGPVYREYFLKYRHPWWQALSEYRALLKAGKSLRLNLTGELKNLAADAKKITTLQKLMPDSIREKYRRDLTVDERSYDALFEIAAAWPFYVKGYSIQWHSDDSRRHSEFLVKAPTVEFNVECKRISVDASRKIRRRDFYRLAEKLIPEIEKMGYSGTIDLTLNDRLHTNEQYLDTLLHSVIQSIRTTGNHGFRSIDQGTLHVELERSSKAAVDFASCYSNLYEKLNKEEQHHAHGAVFARGHGGHPVDPVELILKSNKADHVVSGIRDRISNAVGQLDTSRPGLIWCFLEGIDDLHGLNTDSALQIMTCLELAKPGLSHVAAIGYWSEVRSERTTNVSRFYNEGLLFRNPNCKFPESRSFNFFS
ncbi:MAG: hypothetical protein ACOYXR_05980 [Nitrospirota bacterium]